MVEFLTALNMRVEVHRNHFGQDDADHEWIPKCAANGWVIISGDKGLEKVALNVQAVTSSCAKVFLLTDSNMKGIEWAASIITGRHRMRKIIEENNGPFFATVGKGHDIHVGRPRFVGTGGPKPKAEAIPPEKVAETSVSIQQVEEDSSANSEPTNSNLF